MVFNVEFLRPKPKSSLWLITTGTNHTKNQSGPAANACKLAASMGKPLQATSHAQRFMFCFKTWLRKWLEAKANMNHF